MYNTEDIKSLIVCILVADVLGALIYLSKGNVVGVFNCFGWAIISGFILINFGSIFVQNNK